MKNDGRQLSSYVEFNSCRIVDFFRLQNQETAEEAAA
jgi:hypothetical protein